MSRENRPSPGIGTNEPAIKGQHRTGGTDDSAAARLVSQFTSLWQKVATTADEAGPTMKGALSGIDALVARLRANEGGDGGTPPESGSSPGPG